MWQKWFNVILGLWVVAVPFIGLTSTTLMWTLAVTGLAISALALWGAVEETSDGTLRYQHQS